MDARTARLVSLDRRFVWHPFTQQSLWVNEEPLVIERGEGCWLVTSDGRRFLDGNSSLWVNLWGHDRPELLAALHAQVDALPHATFLGLTNPPAIELAERLVSLSPQGLTRVFFSENGAAAVEVALKLAFAYWRHRGEHGRRLFVCLDNAYHGDTLGAVSVGGFEAFHSLYRDLLFETRRIPSPYCYRCPLDRSYPECALACADVLDEVLAAESGRVAAVITEPGVQAAAGMITAPEGHLRRLREACDRHGVLLIVDEVATGFGRTGGAFACHLEGVRPDLMAVGKALTGGYTAMSATLASEEVYDAFLGAPEEGRTFYHGHSYSGNPLAAAVAVANLDLFASEDLPAVVRRKAVILAEALATLGDLAHVGDIRQRGLMCGIELVRDRATKAPFRPALLAGKRVCDALRNEGIVLRPLGDVVVLVPAPAMTDDDLRFLVAATGRAIERVTPALASSGGAGAVRTRQ
ncbi:MAG: adenosylmethionine--8-amino-7-oxononanoate transaminase [Actinomycetota bacterium]|nr:adenosylmethionine--8-amino-7-oxononanoate transaminase [Actinomycetota bacterium]